MFPLKLILNSSTRTRNIIQNAGVSAVCKVLGIAISFLQVPITLTLLDKAEYGVWLTLYSFICWFAFFDFGIGNGLRNKLTEALALNDMKLAKSYVSTAYVAISVIFLTILAIFLFVAPNINWVRVFNTPASLKNDMLPSVIICFLFTVLNFIVGIINVVFDAYKKSRITNILTFVGQLLVFMLILTFQHFQIRNFVLIIGIFSIMPFLVSFSYSVYFYISRYREVAPSFSSYQKSLLKSVLNLGIKFFFIQIAVTIIYSTDNIIISQLLQPADVTEYNLVSRYFSVISIVFGVLTVPLWTLYVDAYVKKELDWIRSNTKRLTKLWFFFVGISVVLLLCSDLVFKLWIGNHFHPSMKLKVLISVYTLVSIWGSIFVFFINATGKVNLQLIALAIALVLNIPLCIFFVKYMNMGLSGVVVGNITTLLIPSILYPVQYNKLLKGSTSKFWNF